MKISVKNLGVLEHSEIDLSKKLNILCGANNTGKTYMAYLVYGITSLYIWKSITIPEQEFIVNENNTIEIDLVKLFEKYKNEFLNQISIAYKSKLAEVFAINSDFFSDTVISFQIEENDNSIIKNILKNGKDPNDVAQIWNVQKFSNSPILFINPSHFKSKSDNKLDFKSIVSHITSRFEYASLHIWNTYIASSERTAINIFSKEISINRNELVDELLKENNTEKISTILNNRANRYPMPLKEELKIAEDLKKLSEGKSTFKYLAEEIESKILNGKIIVDNYGEIQYSPNGTKNVNLPMHVSASMVKSLSSIVFYFRHLAQAGDLIIIDEPELNLHPDMQRAVARLLARFVNEGFKVLISTHSDYIIKELNLLIMLNNPDKPEAKELQKKYGYQDNELLKPEEIGVYLFKDRHSEVVPISQEGFEIETIDKEINELNHTFKNIYFSLYD